MPEIGAQIFRCSADCPVFALDASANSHAEQQRRAADLALLDGGGRAVGECTMFRLDELDLMIVRCEEGTDKPRIERRVEATHPASLARDETASIATALADKLGR